MGIFSWVEKLLQLLTAFFSRSKTNVIEIDIKVIKPCQAKIEKVWSWSEMRYVKYVIHVSEEGRITIQRIV